MSRASLGVALIVLALSGVTSSQVHAQSIEVIVHPDTNVTSISKSELSKIFFKRLRTWADHTPAVPIDQVPESPARQQFTRLVHNRSVVSVEVYWKRLIFSGRAGPPRELPDDEAVVAFVRSTPGAVGYVGTSANTLGVRRLTVTD
ncbi:MAG: hypothetical protein GY716_08700 [bacterium]|nr:hypothetical protein [bacterium]